MADMEVRRAQVHTCALRGVETIPVTVEIEVGPGMPGWQIVGMADASVQESRLRVRSALRAAGFRAPADRRTVVNLAPASVHKTGSGFDLPIAIAYLVATKQMDASLVEGTIIVGELALEGSVRAVDGLFAYALCAQSLRMRLLSGIPRAKFPDLEDVEHLCIDHLSRLRTGSFLTPHFPEASAGDNHLDFADVVGQEQAVRALTIAAAGGLGALLVGPPGSGKSMLARRVTTILPPLSESEKREVALIHSVAGLDISSIAAGVRPFRSPHHSATVPALVGGGKRLLPGEASLAHRGVLFLDELGEFGYSALQALRQPIEDGEILLARADGKVRFPAKFQLLAASNPCPCGYFGDRTHECTCSQVQLNRYRTKLGGPLKDRIDLICQVNRIDPAKVMKSGQGASSSKILSQVLAARERMAFRGPSRPLTATTPYQVIEACELGDKERDLLEHMARRFDLSGRGIVRVLQVARTIADLDEKEQVEEGHLYEALMYRVDNVLE